MTDPIVSDIPRHPAVAQKSPIVAFPKWPVQGPFSIRIKVDTGGLTDSKLHMKWDRDIIGSSFTTPIVKNRQPAIHITIVELKRNAPNIISVETVEYIGEETGPSSDVTKYYDLRNKNEKAAYLKALDQIEWRLTIVNNAAQQYPERLTHAQLTEIKRALHYVRSIRMILAPGSVRP
jgi:hypothetical protein